MLAEGVSHYDLPTGARLATLVVGSGPPVVCLHGFTGTARRHLGKVLEALSSDYRLIAPDLRGYGAAGRPCATSRPISMTGIRPMWRR